MAFNLLAALVLAMLMFLPARSAEACSCLPSSLSLAGQLNLYDTVFEATVVSVKEHSVLDVTVTLKDQKAWRGRAPTTVTTAAHMAACGYPFEVGTRYLITAQRERFGKVGVGTCGLTRPLDYAKELLELLKQRPPQE